MPSRMICRAVMLLALLAGFATLSAAQNPGPDFAPLFNGKDFTGWDITPDLGAWVVENGEIRCKGKPGTPYLIRTLKEYENFEFYADFTVSRNCNTGIFFHALTAGRESRLGFEAQILDDSGTPPNRTSTGSIYDVVAPKLNAMKPAGEWNRYRVLFDWPRCQIWLNGELVQDTDFSADPILKYRMRRGIIGLSNHGFAVSFRNLSIRELPDREVWTNLFNGRDLSGWKQIGDADWGVRDGMIVAKKGSGYLVTEREFDRFQFQALAENDTLQSRGGGFLYRFHSPEDPGCAADFYDYPAALRQIQQYGKNVPETILPGWKIPWLLYQIISSGLESEVRTGGYVTSKNTLINKTRPGKIAIHHRSGDGVIRIQRVRIRELEGKGL